MDLENLLKPLLPKQGRAQKDLLNRTYAFLDWHDAMNHEWDELRLVDYQQFLLEEKRLAPASVRVHLATLRGFMRKVLADGTLRGVIEQHLPLTDSSEQRVAVIDKTLAKIKATIDDPELKKLTARSKGTSTRLTARQIAQLLTRPNTISLIGLRDKAILALLFTTGIRENELCELNVSDLEQPTDDGPVLHVPSGRGCVERHILYGPLVWALMWVKKWLQEAEISEGPVFRGLYQDRRTLRSTRLSPRALENILSSYPVEADEDISISPLDLRRAHTRLLYEAGLELDEIRVRLGLKDSNALVEYIGKKNASLDTPPDIDFFDTAKWGPKDW